MFDQISLIDGIAWYAVFLFSTTLHEASHAFAALKMGDDTAHRGGQVTLDPTPHIRREPVGMVFVPILSFPARQAQQSVPFSSEHMICHHVCWAAG